MNDLRHLIFLTLVLTAFSTHAAPTTDFSISEKQKNIQTEILQIRELQVSRDELKKPAQFFFNTGGTSPQTFFAGLKFLSASEETLKHFLGLDFTSQREVVLQWNRRQSFTHDSNEYDPFWSLALTQTLRGEQHFAGLVDPEGLTGWAGLGLGDLMMIQPQTSVHLHFGYGLKSLLVFKVEVSVPLF